ncbi:MAG: hypothetical protein WC707_06965 [Candidatus Babeliaceae bacterium]|jgi:hypothetical protein
MAYQLTVLRLTNQRNLETLVNKKITTKKSYSMVQAFVPTGVAGNYFIVPVKEPGKLIGISTGKIANLDAKILCEIQASIAGVVYKGWVNTDVVDAATNTQPLTPSGTAPAPTFDTLPPARGSDTIPPTNTDVNTETIPYTKKPGEAGSGNIFKILLGITAGAGAIAWATGGFKNPFKKKAK